MLSTSKIDNRPDTGSAFRFSLQWLSDNTYYPTFALDYGSCIKGNPLSQCKFYDEVILPV